MASRRFKVVVAVLAVATVAVYLAEPYLAAHDYQQFKEAPAFALQTIDGSTFRLADHAGTPVLIDFMAVWCPPCRETMQTLRMIRGTNDPSDLVLLSVDIDYTETPDQLSGFRADFAKYNGSVESLSWFFALDTVGDYVGVQYGATALPTLVLVDGDGYIRHSWVGTTGAADIQDAVDALG